MEAIQYSTVSGVTYFYAPSVILLKLKVFTCLSRDFKAAILSLETDWAAFLGLHSIIKPDANALFVGDRCVWGTESVKDEVLGNPDVLESVCSVIFPEIDIGSSLKYFKDAVVSYDPVKK